jgi:tetratricopeptide (TPR) repeat protein
MRICSNLTALAAFIAVASPAWAQSTTVQQDFEAATQRSETKDYQGAVAAWEALEKRAAGNPRSLAIVRVRKSLALLALDRKGEAAVAARAGLDALPTSDASLRGDRHDAWLALGRIAESAVDYASAAEAYRQAEALSSSNAERIAAFRGLIETETFVDPDAATADMTRANALMALVPTDAKARAVLKHVESQLLLNRGDFAGARVAAGDGVKLLGGLTPRTDLYDVAARSDYAIAALLEGKPDEARKYMAYTGAGRLDKGSFDPAVQMKVPDCGGEAGLKPEDIAVIEFSIQDDGSVGYSVPVYAAGGGAVALEFARAASNWSWTPEQVKALPTFFRYRARVEMRCSTSFERPSVGEYLDGELGAWLADRKVSMPPMTGGSDAAAAPTLRRQLAAIEAGQGKDALALVPSLHLLAQNRVVSREERLALARRELAVLDANGAVGAARLAAERFVWINLRPENFYKRSFAKDVTPALTTPAYTADPHARAAVRLMLTDTIREFDAPRARAMLNDVVGDPALQANDPLRVGALIRLASLEQASGNIDAARLAFEKSGLSARQCAIVDSAPRRTGADGGSFPQEAMVWGFEGWTQMQFDVAANGRVLGQRAVISYPPFVFDKASEITVKGLRFEKTYRPDGGLGCGGDTQKVIFRLPFKN